MRRAVRVTTEVLEHVLCVSHPHSATQVLYKPDVSPKRGHHAARHLTMLDKAAGLSMHELVALLLMLRLAFSLLTDTRRRERMLQQAPLTAALTAVYSIAAAAVAAQAVDLNMLTLLYVL